MGPSTEAGLTGRTRKRRSARLKLKIPLVISGVDDRGLRFEVPGETLTVSKYGAKVRLSPVPHGIRSGMEVRLKIRSSRRSQFARVVWVGRKSAEEFGVELQRPENFWNVFFPPAEGDEPEAWARTSTPASAAGAGLSVAAAEQIRESPALPQPESPFPVVPPPDFSLICCTADGVEVLVTGMSAVQLPFQERVQMIAVQSDEARLLIRKLVDTGRVLRVVVLSTNQTLKARIIGISEKRQRGKWIVVVRFPHPVFSLD